MGQSALFCRPFGFSTTNNKFIFTSYEGSNVLNSFRSPIDLSLTDFILTSPNKSSKLVNFELFNAKREFVQGKSGVDLQSETTER
ncbi:unnamed protein product [Brachionus calyciflorus]|uniref:Uncharacterized protein n=1 Tax=Brachionus calyciflorus TaxID=104777 RepID=A0A814D2X0_9BILA|nr:unnamed protein product [Brachionus calyciflorus]